MEEKLKYLAYITTLSNLTTFTTFTTFRETLFLDKLSLFQTTLCLSYLLISSFLFHIFHRYPN